MATRRLFVGTERGTVVMREDDGWDVERTALPDKFIHTLLAPDGVGTVFAAVARQGVYRSNDGGLSWNLVLSADVRSMAFDPARPQRVYAGTEPARLFRSDDVGRSWEEIEGLQRLPEEIKDRWWFPQYPHEAHVLSVCVDPRDPRVIYVGLEHGGIYRTDDGGSHWEDVSAGIEYLDIHVVAVDAERDNVCYASTARGFYRSEDRGRTWAISEIGMSRDYFHDMALQPGPPSALFLATANGIPPTWLRAGKAQSAIFRSTDAGLTWQQLEGGLASSLERMTWGLVPDPLIDGRLYAGMGDYAPTMAPDERAGGEVWLSENRGDTWTRIGEMPSPVRALTVLAS